MVSTIKDVAKLAAVSTSTVSKVLNNYDRISEETKNRVLEAVKELNFIPNSTAASLSSKKHNKVALFIYVNDLKQAIDEINMQYLLGAFNKAKELNLEVITIFNPMVSNLNSQELIIYLKSLSINGIIIYGLNKEDTVLLDIIQSEEFFISMVDAPMLNSKTSSIMIDHKLGQYEVAKAMIEPKYDRKILYLAGKRNAYVTDMRIEGIKELADEYHCELRIEYADFSEKKAYELVKKIGSNFNCIVCASDLMAIGAMNALISMNIYRRCCGFDGITLMGYAGKQMLTCKQDFNELSQAAVQEMANLLNGEEARTVILEHEIVQIKYEDVVM